MAIGGVVSITNLSGEVVALSTTSAQSGAFTDAGVLDISSSAECFIAIGTDPTATTTTGYRLLSNATYRMSIDVGQKVAGIVASGTASLYLHRVA